MKKYKLELSVELESDNRDHAQETAVLRAIELLTNSLKGYAKYQVYPSCGANNSFGVMSSWKFDPVEEEKKFSDDGRVFRDCNWNYGRLYDSIADQQLVKDAQLAMSKVNYN